ncbi:MAG: hypothetical protein HOP12_13930 [Candidatus Eisenbacteria bacterium]|uniref:PEP-CTERM sorting domain-containing protein n=1 Tax=Eiseniibacteriota bacterium TaxID=2212470 RepID=A0A849SLD7_UNCEI|nr:hypothetical protein [Candidatus Eisenbacteria bacterium]
MKRKIGAALLAGLLGVASFASIAGAQCVPGQLLDWDEGFAYETAYNPLTFISSLGSNATVVGKLVGLCGPLSGFDASDPTKEYTFVFTALSSNGTVGPQAVGSSTRWTTTYAGGTFAVYEDTTPDAPTAATLPASPPNVDVPSKYSDGTVILSGTLSNFRTQIVLNGGQYISSMLGNFVITGGSASGGALSGTGSGLLQGTWCPNGAGATGLCALPTGFSAVSNGKFDVPPTSVLESTWGAIKAIYR